MTRVNFTVKRLPFLFLLALAPGCSNPVDPIVKQIDEAIEEFKEARRGILADSQQWKLHTEKLLDNADEKVRKILEDGTLGRFLDARANNLIDETKTTLVLVERRLLGYLNGVIKALEKKREEVKKKGGVPSDTIESILAEVIASVDDVEPFVGNTTSAIVEYLPASGKRVLQVRDIEFRGFGFTGRDFELVGMDRRNKPVWKAAPVSLAVSTDFRLIFVPDKTSQPDAGVERLAILWEGQELASVVLREASPPPVKPKLTSVRISFIGEEKYPTVAFSAEFGVYEANGKTPLTQWGGLGAGRLWKADVLQREGENSLNREMDLSSALLYLELQMSPRLGGKVEHEYMMQPGVGFPPRFYSKTHKPKWVYNERELLRMGFLKEGDGRYKKRNPTTLVRGDWKGRVRIQIRYAGKIIDFDESPEFVFKEGKTERGSFLLNLRWAGNGRIAE